MTLDFEWYFAEPKPWMKPWAIFATGSIIDVERGHKYVSDSVENKFLTVTLSLEESHGYLEKYSVKLDCFIADYWNQSLLKLLSGSEMLSSCYTFWSE